MNKKEIIRELDNTPYGFIATQYNELTKEQLRDILKELIYVSTPEQMQKVIKELNDIWEE